MNSQARLERLERSVQTLRRRIEGGAACLEILSLLSGIRTAVDKLAADITICHVEACFSKLAERHFKARLQGTAEQSSPDPDQRSLDELARIISQLVE